MTTQSCDVVVVGLGPGGEAAATQLAKAGLEVVGIDERLVGGECPYFGCIPSKMIIRGADALGEARRVPEFAGASQVEPDWTPVATRIRDEATDDWDDAVAVKRLQDAGVTFVRGHGRLAGPKAIEVGEHRYEARRGVVLNTGTRPAAPPIEGLADTPYWTNRDVLRSESLPASLAVIGGGPIGAELAQAIGRFGVRVTLVEIGPRILGPEEPEAGDLLAEVMTKEGVQVLADVEIASVSYAEGHFTLDLGDQQVTADKLLVAAGRAPNLDDVGLETVGLDPTARTLETDEHMAVQDGLWAIGDIAGHGAFTHMSMYEAQIAARAILGTEGFVADYRAVPHVTFTDPEVGGVGMTEKQAREAGLTVAVGTQDLSANTRGWIAKAQGLIKLVADTDRDVLVGGTVVGPAGGEILGMITMAVHAEVPIATLRSMVGAYPTLHRGFSEALADLT
ncbi:NAD(P)/FAD-dependent oxidoreductase [Nocardioides mangrovicus]|uniref:NAD(P)/FAD-dependent oxidoreductase n=1 Tax=Nocardioides mangrovicus TaxID=2478913 RepID=A0A3L8P479_9ACTN|nr:FAD-dependent oxidoreductase [Nocardioides mangrovicus]RLV50210.1 NAD(P)/FAD-dependent oxidoreductase [Nocardioides mangrovicus]